MRSAALIFAALLIPAEAFAAKPKAPKKEERMAPQDLTGLRKSLSDCRKSSADAWKTADLSDALLKGIRTSAMRDSEAGALLQTCIGLEQPDRCASLLLPEDDDHNCRRFKDVLALIKGMFKGNDPQGTCVWYMGLTKDDAVAPAAKARLCKKAVEVLKDPRQYDSFCEKMLAHDGDTSPKKLQSCKNLTISLKGQPKLCDLPGTPIGLRGYCRVMSGAVAALNFNQPATCAAVPLCSEALNGTPAKCASYEAALNKEFCAQAAASLAGLEEGQQRLLAEDDAARKKEAEAVAAAKAAEASKKPTPPEPKRQFKEGEPMQSHTGELMKRMKEIEKGKKAAPRGDE